MNDATGESTNSARRDVYVEHGTGMAYDTGVVAWTFDANNWGRCGQGEDEARAGTRALLDACGACGSELLDFDNPVRVLPSWARWRTLPAMFWHVVDTECRYYFPGLGRPDRPRAEDLDTELDACAAHVRATVIGMPDDLLHHHRDEEWTSTKVLRRLAWHERGELTAMRDLAVANAALLGLRLKLPAATG
jgi:hypothetical protein